MKLRWFGTVALFAFAGLLVACSQESDGHKPAAVPTASLEVTEARVQTVAETVTLPGTVTREKRARLASPYGGPVTLTTVAAGTWVKHGALLLEVGSADARARLASATAQAAGARAAAQQAAADEKRFRALRAQGAVAPREYERVHQRYVTARAQARAAEQALVAARSDLRYADVRAPFDGLLAERPVKTGDDAAPGALLALVVGGAPEVELQAGSSVYPHLPLHAHVGVTVDGHDYDGTVVERVDAADPMTRSHRIKLRLSGGPSPPYGAYAQVHVPVGRRGGVVVPAAAVVERAGLTGVFVVGADGRAQFRVVRVAGAGSGRSDTTVLAAGVQAGEPVVIGPPLSLGNGSLIRAKRRP